MTARHSAMLIPKPTRPQHQSFMPAIVAHDLAFMLGALAPSERQAMATIAESADVFTFENQSWLLVPAPAWLIDTLALFGAECEDREPGLDDEAETDMGVDDMGELDLSDYEADGAGRPNPWPDPGILLPKKPEGG